MNGPAAPALPVTTPSARTRYHLVLPAIGRARHDVLLRMLESLQLQQDVEIDLTLVYQSLDAQAPAEVATALSRLPNARLLHSRPCCASAARNQACPVSPDAALVGFPDDDAWYAPDLLANVAAVFAAHPRLDVLCIGVRDPQTGLAYGNRPHTSKLIRVCWHNCFWLPLGPGIFFRSKVLRDLAAPFDERLGTGNRWASGEETDLIYRLLGQGCSIAYFGGLEVYHAVQRFSTPEDVTKAARYGLGYGAMLGKQLARGNLTVFYPLLDITARGIAGALLSLLRNRPLELRRYLHRTAQILLGFPQGFFYYRRHKAPQPPPSTP